MALDDFAVRLKAFQKARKLDNNTLADLCQMHPATIVRWRAGLPVSKQGWEHAVHHFSALDTIRPAALSVKSGHAPGKGTRSGAGRPYPGNAVRRRYRRTLRANAPKTHKTSATAAADEVTAAITALVTTRDQLVQLKAQTAQLTHQLADAQTKLTTAFQAMAAALTL